MPLIGQPRSPRSIQTRNPVLIPAVHHPLAALTAQVPLPLIPALFQPYHAELGGLHNLTGTIPFLPRPCLVVVVAPFLIFLCFHSIPAPATHHQLYSADMQTSCFVRPIAAAAAGEKLLWIQDTSSKSSCECSFEAAELELIGSNSDEDSTSIHVACADFIRPSVWSYPHPSSACRPLSIYSYHVCKPITISRPHSAPSIFATTLFHV